MHFCISRYFPLRGIGQGLYIGQGGISRELPPWYFPYIKANRCSHLYVYLYLVCQYLMYFTGENAKYLYLITSTWSIWVLDQLYLTPTLIGHVILLLSRHHNWHFSNVIALLRYNDTAVCYLCRKTCSTRWRRASRRSARKGWRRF